MCHILTVLTGHGNQTNAGGRGKEMLKLRIVQYIHQSVGAFLTYLWPTARLLMGDLIIKKLFPDTVSDTPTQQQIEEMQ